MPCADQLRQADLLFFDGTLFTDDEMIAAGLGPKTGRRMGHVPVSGPGGTLEGLADLPGRRDPAAHQQQQSDPAGRFAGTAAGRGGRLRNRL